MLQSEYRLLLATGLLFAWQSPGPRTVFAFPFPEFALKGG